MKVLILGCGWVGEEFAQLALKQRCEVYATVTNEEKAIRLRQEGLHIGIFDANQENGVFPFEAMDFDFVLNSIPSSKRSINDAIVFRFEHLNRSLESLRYQKHIYLSSVGIYPDETGVFDENYNDQEQMDQNLYQAEHIMRSLPNTIIYRLGGLFGKSRIMAKYFEDKVYSNGQQTANFVHLDDVVQLIWLGFQKGLQNPVYNIVAPEHPMKEEVIRASATKYDFRLPTSFETEKIFQKIVDSGLIREELDYEFKYKSPVDF